MIFLQKIVSSWTFPSHLVRVASCVKHRVACYNGTEIAYLFEFLQWIISPCWWHDTLLTKAKTFQVTLLLTFQLEVSLNKGCLLSSCLLHRLYALRVKLWPLLIAKTEKAAFWGFILHSAPHSLAFLWVQIFESSHQFWELWAYEFLTCNFSDVFSRDAELPADSLGHCGRYWLPSGRPGSLTWWSL